MGWYPLADRTTVGTSGGTYTGGPFKGVLHTTEGTSASGAIAAFKANNSWPHFLIDNAGKVWQFVDTDVAGRALRNLTGGVQTNRDSAIQVEIVGFAGKPNEHPVAQVTALAALMRWVEASEGVQPKGPGRPFATVYGQNNLRFSPAEWEAFDGWCGHCHVPENLHWDPGAIDMMPLLPVAPPEPEPEPILLKPMYDPPFEITGGVAAYLQAPNGGAWLVSYEGHMYAFGAGHYGQPAGKDYFVGRRAARLEPFGEGYTVVATSNERYDYPRNQ